MNYLKFFFFACLTLLFAACEGEKGSTLENVDTDAPTKYTIKHNKSVAEQLPLDDQQDLENAKRGFIAAIPKLIVKKADGDVVWDQTAYEFMQGKAPESVNPSLWRQAKLNNIHGLFKVTEGIYQLRGFDLANITLIEGKTGWIIVDPLTSKETAKRAFSFAMAHLEKKPISAILFTHSHVDHFGGVTGIISPEKAAADKVRIIAPVGFMEEAISENIIAGIAMARRSVFMYGSQLPRNQYGHVGTGLGKEVTPGTIGILQPTELIDRTLQETTIDGVRFVFQNVPGSEAPAEMAFYLPDYKTFCGAEIVSRTMHNLYTLRGAKVRDSLKWSRYIDEAMNQFGESEVYFGTHNWPLWGNENIIKFMQTQRDVYKFIHDQTIRLANSGYTPREIAEQIKLPESLRSTFSNRGYYGTLSHNVKAVYQHYFGWYDANPANLNPLPPQASAVKYTEYMGGSEKILSKARESFDKGEYRWVAEVLNHLVFAEPDNKEARHLLAAAYKQLGYQAESGPWRDVYLTGAYELKNGIPEKVLDIKSALELLQQTPISKFLDSMAARLNAPKAEGKKMKINVVFTDLNKSYQLKLENSVLHYKQAAPDSTANATVRLTHKLYLNLAIGEAGIGDLLLSDDIKYSGSKIDLIRFFALFDMPKGDFNIVTP